MPNDNAGSTHISLRVPSDLIQAFDKLAVILERPRSWVMVRALGQYLEDEGAELAEDVESLAELDRGEAGPDLGLDAPARRVSADRVLE